MCSHTTLYLVLTNVYYLGAINLNGGVFKRSKTATPGLQSVNCTGRFSWGTCSRSLASTDERCEEAAVVCQGNICDYTSHVLCRQGPANLEIDYYFIGSFVDRLLVDRLSLFSSLKS